MKKLYSRLKLSWFDDCFRAGEFILSMSLLLSALYALIALAEQFGVWILLWLFGAVYLYTRPKIRGIDNARTIKDHGYRFKVWQGYSGRWYWQSIEWPGDALQGWQKSEYEATEEARGYIQYFLPALPEAPLSARELKNQKIYQSFCNWVEESGLGCSPSVNTLRIELDYQRNGDDRLQRAAITHYENKNHN